MNHETDHQDGTGAARTAGASYWELTCDANLAPKAKRFIIHIVERELKITAPGPVATYEKLNLPCGDVQTLLVPAMKSKGF
jgi:hypothetical protein